MKLRILLAASVAAISVAAIAAPASAGIITAPAAGSSFVAFPSGQNFGPGPVVFDSGEITWSSTNCCTQGGSVFPYDGGYGFVSNGFVSGTPMAGLNDASSIYGSVDTMEFDFTNPVSSVGGVLNWVPDFGDFVHIDFYNGATLLGSLTLNNGGGNVVAPNSFYGFQSGSANITSFKLTDGYVGVIGGLNISAAPEPAAWALTIMGFMGAGAMLRRRRALAA